ncbi:transposase [Thermobispora bispora]|uniref:transposase n=1 Tax=Thermobispora bispora TaxID=2006 RepID=UPI0011D23742
MDSTIVRAHQSETGAAEKGGTRASTNPRTTPRGGSTYMIHLTYDGTGCPLTVVLTWSNRNDHTSLLSGLGSVRAPRPESGRPPTSTGISVTRY